MDRSIKSSCGHAGWIRSVTGVLLGIAAPVLYVVLEYKTHCLSGCLFDPIPSPAHLLALVVVPLAHVFALTGARWQSNWLLYPANLLRWPALIAPVYYSLATGLHLQGLALVASPFLMVSWAVHGFVWPAGGPERLEAESMVNAVLIVQPALAIVGWWCMRPYARACATGLSATLQPTLRCLGAVLAILCLSLVELPLVRAYLAIRDFAEGEREAHRNNFPLKWRDHEVAMVSRLFHAPPQFSSDGVLDCEGPVDVFGPAVRLMNRWSSPTTMWRHLTAPQHVRWGELLQQIRTSNPNADTSPRSWRGLSPWEERELMKSSAMPESAISGQN